MINVYFTEEGHRYFDDNGDQWESVSSITGQYHKPFDTEYTLRYCAIKELFPKMLKESKKKKVWDDRGIVVEIENKMSSVQTNGYFEAIERLEKEWSGASEFGTWWHKTQEDKAIKQGYAINPIDGLRYMTVLPKKSDKYDNKYILPYVLANYKQNVYIPECILIDPLTKTAGQADCIFLKYNSGRWVFGNLDFKTDKKLDRRAFYDQFYKNGINKADGIKKKKRTFYYPFDHIIDNHLFYYMIKMSIYGKMMMNLGIHPGDNALIHTPAAGTHNIINLPLHPNLAQRILDIKAEKVKYEYGNDVNGLFDRLVA
jgi:hypothetical protein